MDERYTELAEACSAPYMPLVTERIDKVFPPDAAETVLRGIGERILDLAFPALEGLAMELLRETEPFIASHMYLNTADTQAKVRSVLSNRLRNEGPGVLYGAVPLLEQALPRAAGDRADAMIEMWERLNARKAEIESELFAGKPLGAFRFLKSGFSDAHNHGRGTVKLVFDAGTFYYKPHSVATDRVYHACVKTLFPEELEAAPCVTGDGYGFCGAVQVRPVGCRKELHAYYRNLGLFAALAQALGMSDLHMENLLASGTKPALIDLETVLTPEVAQYADPAVFPRTRQSENAFEKDFALSLFRTAMLPKNTCEEKAMSLLFASGGTGENLPEFEEKHYNIRGFEDVFADGFRDGCRRCADCRDALESLFGSLAGEQLRLVPRRTATYAKIQRGLFGQKLDAEQARSKAEAMLISAFEKRGASEFDAMVRAEAAAIVRGDIPYFTVRGDGLDLLCDGEPVAEGFLSRSATEIMRIRIERIGPEETRFEEELFRRTVELTEEKEKAPAEDNTAIPEPKAVSREDALKWAEGCMEMLLERKIHSPSGGSSWMTVRTADGVISDARQGLYDGKIGIALFAAAMGSVTGRNDLRVAAKEIVADELDILNSRMEEYRKAERIPELVLPLGMAEGLGGILAAMPLISAYTKDEKALELARESIALAAKASVEESGKSGVDGGTAGLLKVLLTVPEYRDLPEAEALARRCADRLLAMRIRTRDGVSFWRNDKGVLLSGTVNPVERPDPSMGNGLAGIGCALTLAGLRWGREDCLSAGREALDYVCDHLPGTAGIWSELMDGNGNAASPDGYARGLPGIGLALLHCLRAGIGDGRFAETFETSVKIIRGRVPFRDDPAYGGMASVDLLLENGDRESAGKLLGALGHRAEKGKGWTTTERGTVRGFCPSLYGGISGIGYVCLRYADPERIRAFL